MEQKEDISVYYHRVVIILHFGRGRFTMKKSLFKNPMLLFSMAILVVFAFNCTEEKATSNNTDTDGYTHLDLRGECLERPTTPDPVYGYMVLEANGNDLEIQHLDAYYNCCIGYAVDYQIENFNITAAEQDTAFSGCFCECYFNLKSTLFDLPGGLYTVTLLGIGGDTVGTDTVTVGG